MPGKVYPGAASQTQVNGTFTAGSPGVGNTYTVANAAGYLSGTQVVVVDRENASSEKMLVTYPGSGVTFTVVLRGFDGTTAVGHDNPSHEACWDAQSATEFAAFVEGVGTVSTAHLANDAVTNAKLADDSVDSAQIVANAVGTSEIAADAVGTSEIATDAVTAAEIAPGAVGTSEIATDGVGTDEIAALAVGAAELAANAVTTAKILDANVTAAKMADSPTVDATASQVDAGGVTINNDSGFVTLCTDTITLDEQSIVAICPTVSLRTQTAITGDFDYRSRVTVDGANHPGGTAMSTRDGWTEVVTADFSSNWLHEPSIYWPLAAGTYVVNFDMLVATASAGDLRATDPSLHTYQMRFA